MKLSAKLTLYVLGVTLVLAPLLGWIVYERAGAVLEASIRADELRAARQTMETIDRALSAALQSIRILASDAEIQQGLRSVAAQATANPSAAVVRRQNAQRTASLARKALLTGPWDFVLITNAAGQVVAANEARLRGTTSEEAELPRAALEEVRAGRIWISDLIRSPLNPSPTVIFAAPVHEDRASDQPVIGAVMGFFAWPAVLDILEETASASRIRLVNREGVVIGAPKVDKSEILQANLRSHPALFALFANTRAADSSAIVAAPGAESSLAFAVRQQGHLSFRGNEWALLREVPTRIMTRPLRGLARDISLAVVGLMAVMAACFYVIGRQLTRPLREVTQLTDEFAAGHLGRRAHVHTRDEAGQLAAAFNRMAEQIQQNTSALEREIAERRSIETALHAAKVTAEEASRAKSDFLARMSHEIRTPMNGILGMAELTLDTPLPPAQHRYVENIRSSGRALLGIINDVLDFSKIEAGKLELAEAPFSLRTEVGMALRTIAIKAQEKNIELLYHVRSRVPDALTGDALRLRQVILNLVGNAIKFTERGSVKVKVELVETAPSIGHNIAAEVTKLGSGESPPTSLLTPAAPADSAITRGAETPSPPMCWLHFTVADTGPGIPPEKQAQIFEAFTQADISIARTHGGTGLGLSIAAQLVQLMGGRLRVESTMGEGSRFHFTLPCKTRAEPAAALRPEDLRGLTALIVDDSPATREILEENLTGWGMKPRSVASGEEGLAELRRASAAREPYALLFLDLELPEGMHGWEVAAAIRRDPALAGTRIVIISLSAGPDDLARIEALRIDAYHSKPFISSDVLASIQVALHSGPEVLAPRHENESFVKIQTHALDRAERPLRILVAEDTRINQEVVQGMLGPRGHHIAIAANGTETVACFQREPFDLILMDMHMPEMDGLAATREIRRLENARGPGGAPIRIVALTANAVKGDRERCLAAGMDGYLSKPIDRLELLATVESTLVGSVAAMTANVPTAHASVEVAISATTSVETPALELEKLQEQFGGDPTVLRELVNVMLEELPAMLLKLQQALERQDDKAVRLAAHSLKGALAQFGARTAMAVAQQLEALARTGTLHGAAGLHEELERHVATVKLQLEVYLAGTPPP